MVKFKDGTRYFFYVCCTGYIILYYLILINVKETLQSCQMCDGGPGTCTYPGGIIQDTPEDTVASEDDDGRATSKTNCEAAGPAAEDTPTFSVTSFCTIDQDLGTINDNNNTTIENALSALNRTSCLTKGFCFKQDDSNNLELVESTTSDDDNTVTINTQELCEDLGDNHVWKKVGEWTGPKWSGTAIVGDLDNWAESSAKNNKDGLPGWLANTESASTGFIVIGVLALVLYATNSYTGKIKFLAKTSAIIIVIAAFVSQADCVGFDFGAAYKKIYCSSSSLEKNAELIPSCNADWKLWEHCELHEHPLGLFNSQIIALYVIAILIIISSVSYCIEYKTNVNLNNISFPFFKNATLLGKPLKQNSVIITITSVMSKFGIWGWTSVSILGFLMCVSFSVYGMWGNLRSRCDGTEVVGTADGAAEENTTVNKCTGEISWENASDFTQGLFVSTIPLFILICLVYFINYSTIDTTDKFLSDPEILSSSYTKPSKSVLNTPTFKDDYNIYKLLNKNIKATVSDNENQNKLLKDAHKYLIAKKPLLDTLDEDKRITAITAIVSGVLISSAKIISWIFYGLREEKSIDDGLDLLNLSGFSSATAFCSVMGLVYLWRYRKNKDDSSKKLAQVFLICIIYLGCFSMTRIFIEPTTTRNFKAYYGCYLIGLLFFGPFFWGLFGFEEFNKAILTPQSENGLVIYFVYFLLYGTGMVIMMSQEFNSKEDFASKDEDLTPYWIGFCVLAGVPLLYTILLVLFRAAPKELAQHLAAARPLAAGTRAVGEGVKAGVRAGALHGPTGARKMAGVMAGVRAGAAVAAEEARKMDPASRLRKYREKLTTLQHHKDARKKAAGKKIGTTITALRRKQIARKKAAAGKKIGTKIAALKRGKDVRKKVADDKLRKVLDDSTTRAKKKLAEIAKRREVDKIAASNANRSADERASTQRDLDGSKRPSLIRSNPLGAAAKAAIKQDKIANIAANEAARVAKAKEAAPEEISAATRARVAAARQEMEDKWSKAILTDKPLKKLKELCKERNLSTEGDKNDLAIRLMNSLEDDENSSSESESESADEEVSLSNITLKDIAEARTPFRGQRGGTPVPRPSPTRTPSGK